MIDNGANKKRTFNITIHLNEEEEIKIKKVAEYLQRTTSEVIRLASMEIINKEYNKILVDQANGTMKKPIFRTEDY